MRECQGCRCGLCCGGWPIVATEQDAEREPLIRDCRRNGQGEYLLNRPGSACRFFEKDPGGIGRCTIYTTRPAVCQRFECDGAQGQLIRENPGRFYFDSEEERAGVGPIS